jgi:formylglycine-generating enzyme required for sulfatase activity
MTAVEKNFAPPRAKLAVPPEGKEHRRALRDVIRRRGTKQGGESISQMPSDLSLNLTTSRTRELLFRRVSLELVHIPAGAFIMGSEEHHFERPLHAVTISKPFYIGKMPVTQEQWQAVMGNKPWKRGIVRGRTGNRNIRAVDVNIRCARLLAPIAALPISRPRQFHPAAPRREHAHSQRG